MTQKFAVGDKRSRAGGAGTWRALSVAPSTTSMALGRGRSFTQTPIRTVPPGCVQSGPDFSFQQHQCWIWDGAGWVMPRWAFIETEQSGTKCSWRKNTAQQKKPNQAYSVPFLTHRAARPCCITYPLGATAHGSHGQQKGRLQDPGHSSLVRVTLNSSPLDTPAPWETGFDGTTKTAVTVTQLSGDSFVGAQRPLRGQVFCRVSPWWSFKELPHPYSYS